MWPWLLKVRRVVAVVVTVILLMVQMWSNVSLWLREPLATSYTLDTQSSTSLLPSITLCPFPPFHIPSLGDMGLNISAISSWQEVLDFLEKAEDIDATPEEVWITAAWNLGDVVRQLDAGGTQHIYTPGQKTGPGWSRSFTPLGPCLTYRPSPTGPLLGASIQLQVNRYLLPKCENGNFYLGPENECHDAEKFCNTSCNWQILLKRLTVYNSYQGHCVILHSSDDPPTLVDTDSVIPLQQNTVGFNDVDIWVKPKHLQQLDSGNSTCRVDSRYSEAQCRQVCSEPCHPRSLVRRPHHPTWTSGSYNQSCLWDLEETDFEYQNLSKEVYACTKKCLPRCTKTVFDYIVHDYLYSRISNSYILVTVKAQANFLPTLTESQAYPLWRLLADAGGSLGFFLGMSLLSIWAYLGRSILGFTHGSQVQQCEEEKEEQHHQPRRGWSDSHHTPEEKKGKTTGRGKLWVKLWEVVGVTFLLVFTCLHCLVTLASYLKNPLTTSVMLTRDPPPFPEVVVCPDLPFKPQVMTNFGIHHIQEDPYDTDRDNLVTFLLKNLPGFWQVGNTDLGMFWRAAARDKSEILQRSFYDGKSVDGWKSVLTTNNICYQFMSSNLSNEMDKRDLQLSFSDTDFDDEKEFFNNIYYTSRKTIRIVIPDYGLAPVLISSKGGFSHIFDSYKAQGQELLLLPLILRNAPPCLSSPYNHARCLQNCMLQASTVLSGCTMPYINLTHLPRCKTEKQYHDSQKYFINPNSISSSTITDCTKKCPKQCLQTHYLIDNMKKMPTDIQFKITLLDKYYMIINEYESHSTSSLLCQVGGIVGLYIGWSVLGAVEALRNIVAPITGRSGSGRGMFQVMKGVISTSCTLLCFLTSAVLWSGRVYEYVWNHPYYTTYSVEPIMSDDFPAMTVCRWPPFNLSRLLQLGLVYNITTNCKNYGGRLYRCSRGTEVIRELPGLWGEVGGERRNLSQVWKEAAWDLHDLVTDYSLDYQHFTVSTSKGNNSGGGKVGGVWRAVMTEHNRCFTFSPPLGTSLTSYTLGINTQYSGKRKITTKNTLKMLHSALEIENPPFTFISVHDRHVNLYKFPEDDSFSAVHYVRPSSIQFEVQQTEMRILPRTERPCKDTPLYSQEECKARCYASHMATMVGCNLPYFTWGSRHNHLPLCNTSYTYFHFPRRMGNREVHKFVMFTFNENQSFQRKIKADCETSCPLACTTRLSTFKQRFSSSSNSRISVKFRRPSRDLLVEQDGYTWAQLLSDIGGVAGFMLGVSILSVLHILTRLLHDGLVHCADILTNQL